MLEKKDNRKIAIYSRKSKFTGKGESTSNQIELCKKKISYQFENIDIEKEVCIYEDEGFTGYNTNRPAFQRMLQDIRANKIKVIAFYKLDRISRNVTDFSKLVTELEEYHVTFLSATESIESISPSGRAMMYMISVFAQLERDTIAERIKDNMLELAKTGRWLGGISPTGYSSEQIEEITFDGKKRKLYKLVQNEEINKVKLIYSKMLLFKSLTKLETYLLNNNNKTKNDKYFTRWSLKNILTNPVYLIADHDAYLYFKKNYKGLYAASKDFDGKHGLMAYNKTRKNKGIKKREKEEWIIAVGKHEGIIKGHIWIKIQEILKTNHNMRYRKSTTQSPSILSGIIRCLHCGSFLRPKIRAKQTNERKKFDYICELKEKSHKTKCNCQNINGIALDSFVLNIIYTLPVNLSLLSSFLEKEVKKRKKEKNRIKQEVSSLQNKMKKNEKHIASLIHSLNFFDEKIIKEIKKEINLIKLENEELEKKIYFLNKATTENKDTLENRANKILSNYLSSFQAIEIKEKKERIGKIFDKILVSQKKVIFYLKGSTLPIGENSK